MILFPQSTARAGRPHFAARDARGYALPGLLLAFELFGPRTPLLGHFEQQGFVFLIVGFLSKTHAVGGVLTILLRPGHGSPK